jgi:hypothetical protein
LNKAKNNFMSQIKTSSIKTSRPKQPVIQGPEKAEAVTVPLYPCEQRQGAGSRPADRFSKDDLLGVFALYWMGGETVKVANF